MLCQWIAPLFVMQIKMLITIQSHCSLIIPVMMWINYQLNSWSHKSVVDLLHIMGCYSLDSEVNRQLTVQRHAHTRLVWFPVTSSTDGANTNLNRDDQHTDMQWKKQQEHKQSQHVYCMQWIHMQLMELYILSDFIYSFRETLIQTVFHIGLCLVVSILQFTVQDRPEPRYLTLAGGSEMEFMLWLAETQQYKLVCRTKQRIKLTPC